MQPLGTQEKIDHLVSGGGLKVWSLIATILGDLCVTRTDVMPGKVLHMLTGRMGVSGQAVRVALHRLRRNGWINSERDGRESNHALSDTGWAETQTVRPLIYADTPVICPVVRLVVVPAPANGLPEMLPADAITIAPRTALVGDPAPRLPDDAVVTVFEPGQLPDWVVDLVVSRGLRGDYAALTESVCAVMKHAAPASVIDRTVLRLLVLHQWRRLRLRHGALPDTLLGADWEGAQARDSVMQALSKFDRPTIDDLTRDAVPAGG